VIVMERQRGAPDAGRERDHAALRIDRLDFPGVKIRPRRHAADRRDDVIQLHGAGDHLRQQRLEDHVILAVDQGDLDFLQLLRGKELAEVQRGVNASETTAEDEDAFFGSAHRSINA